LRPYVALVLMFGALLAIQTQSPAQDTSDYLARMERQTREENVCMLLQKDGHFHLERIVTGRPRVFEGTLVSASVSELESLVNAQQIVDLKQTAIETSLVGEDLDQFLIAISRPNGWQSLSFPSGKSRKPFKTTLDPILKWLDRNKQQQNPITGAPTNRCMPQQSQNAQTETAATKPNTTNPYIMRIVADHYEPSRLGGPSADAATKSGGASSASSAQTMNSTVDMKITRMCVVVYESGRYRMEKSIQEFGSQVRSDIYRDTLDATQANCAKFLITLSWSHFPTAPPPPFLRARAN